MPQRIPSMRPVPVPKELATRPKPATPWWQNERIVTRILAIAGALITIIGIGFLVALAIQHGLLGPLSRVILAYLLAVVLLGCAAWLQRKKPTNPGINALVFASYLTATITTQSLVDILHWWPWFVGMLVHIALGIGFIALCRTWAKPILALILLLPAFFFLSTFVPAVGAMAGVAVFATVVITLSYRRHWPFIAPLTVGGLLLTSFTRPYGNWDDAFTNNPHLEYLGRTFIYIDSITVTIAVFAILALVTLQQRVDDSDPSSDVYAAFRGGTVAALPVVLYFQVWDFFAATAATAYWTTVFLLLIAAGFVLPRLRRSTGTELVPYVVNSGLICFYLFLWTIDWLQGRLLLTLVALALTTALFVGYRLQPGAIAKSTLVLALIGIVMELIERIGLAWRLGYSAGMHAVVLERESQPLPILTSLLTIGLVAALVSMYSLKSESNRFRMSYAGFGLWLSSIPIVLLTTAVGVSGGLAGTDAFLFGHTIVSVTWMTLAGGLLLYRNWPLKESTTLGAGFVLATVATAKLIFFDLEELTGLARVLAFLVCGLLLIGMATWRSNQDRSPRPESQKRPGEQPQETKKPAAESVAQAEKPAQETETSPQPAVSDWAL
ncbi:DUF2339 domain-containing protein [Corynebacterium ulceribovis]|uniref:DUF2339 domain-containing protein n=1 Tax=Corynebacterium ulceribovis TaxID=487732 RepID=UPI000366E001|nr:DUF2339 domain-containing protein [Corynebacterium ulceribovis]